MNKICLILPQFKTGGGNRVFIELANKLVDTYEIEIIYPNNSQEKNNFEIDKKIKIISIGKFSEKKIYKILNIIRLIIWLRKNRKKSKIIITDPIMSILSLFFPKYDLWRFIQADDYNLFDLNKEIIKNKAILKIYKKLVQLSYKQKKINFLFNSKFVYKKFQEISKRNNIKNNLVHPGINIKIFKNNFNRKNQKPNICLLARKHPLKGLDIFLKVWENFSIKEKNMIGDINIIYFENIDILEKYKSRFKFYKPKSDIEIANIFNKSDIFISTSIWEGYGLPTLEAMGCGCAILSSNNGGSNEYLTDNNSLIFNICDINDFKEKLIELLNNKNKIKKLSLESVKTAQNFTWDNTVSQLKKIIEGTA